MDDTTSPPCAHALACIACGLCAHCRCRCTAYDLGRAAAELEELELSADEAAGGAL